MLQNVWDLPSSSDSSWEIHNMAGLDKMVQKTRKNIQSKYILSLPASLRISEINVQTLILSNIVFITIYRQYKIVLEKA